MYAPATDTWIEESGDKGTIDEGLTVEHAVDVVVGEIAGGFRHPELESPHRHRWGAVRVDAKAPVLIGGLGGTEEVALPFFDEPKRRHRGSLDRASNIDGAGYRSGNLPRG